MKLSKYLSITIFAITISLMSSYAVTPSLTIYDSSANIKSISVYGDPNANVTLYFHKSSNLNAYNSIYLGVTNSQGYLQYNFDIYSTNAQTNDNVYVIVNNQQSPYVRLPGTYYNNQYYNQPVTETVYAYPVSSYNTNYYNQGYVSGYNSYPTTYTSQPSVLVYDPNFYNNNYNSYNTYSSSYYQPMPMITHKSKKVKKYYYQNNWR